MSQSNDFQKLKVETQTTEAIRNKIYAVLKKMRSAKFVKPRFFIASFLRAGPYLKRSKLRALSKEIEYGALS